MANISIYSSPTCVYCNMTKSFLKTHGMKFTDFDISTDLEKRKEMIDKTGQMGIPVIDIGGAIVIGYNESKFRELLGIKD